MKTIIRYSLFPLLAYLSLFLSTTTSLFWQSSTSRYSKSVNGKNIEVYASSKPKRSLIFFTGGFNKMPNFIYSDFLTELSENGVTCYSVQDNIDYKVISFIENEANELPIIASHSSGSVPALELCSLVPIEDIVLFDPVGFGNFKLRSAKNVVFINAELSYSWDKFMDLPFIPSIFAITEKNLVTSANITRIEYDDYGHGDILNSFWADVSVMTQIIKGNEDRNDEVNKKYRELIVKNILDMITSDEKMKESLPNSIIKSDVNIPEISDSDTSDT
tara:strand:- start:108 stop:932 length:825 start_codon:yes stop_codon:yes gene_type:complete